ncbi:DUF1573 domain-containing protein [bacterium]|nr:DUF1573 domain-containing protein [bacterium]
MQRLLAGILVFWCSVICLATQPPESEEKSSARPKLEFVKVEHDFGKNVSGPELKHSFVFKNTGNAPLFIEKVKAG